MANELTSSLAEKSALITGGTTGIGRETALLLAKHGARVMIFGRHHQELNEALQTIRDQIPSGQVQGIVADVSDQSDIQRVFSMLDEAFGNIDILINNAGLGYASVMKGEYKDWSYIVNTNLLGYMACAHEAIKRMEKNHRGHIVNIGSMSADTKEANSSVYVATKAGINGFSTSLRKEANPKGIKVTLIEPGAVNTDMQKQSPTKKKEQVVDLHMLEATDIAQAILYVLNQPLRCDVVFMQIRPHLQLI